ncbi:hypothetical protein [Methanobacterium paludis]|nr:hypothetical protein [Methanobacterium paludis]
MNFFTYALVENLFTFHDSIIICDNRKAVNVQFLFYFRKVIVKQLLEDAKIVPGKFVYSTFIGSNFF